MEKGGLTQTLRQAGLRQGGHVVWGDEMRIGLHGQVRRRWVPRGVKLRQKVQLVYVWRYLALWVDASGGVSWTWVASLRKEGLAEIVAGWKADGGEAIVWDNAPSHKAHLVRQVGVPLVPLPAYAPELNPAERVFEELRRVIEGHVYGRIEDKVALVEQEVRARAAAPERVLRRTGWTWLQEALVALPT